MKPIALTLGDPAGIGPEVILKTLRGGVDQLVPWVLVGRRWALERTAEALNYSLPSLRSIEAFGAAMPGLNSLEVGPPQPEDFRFGAVQAACGAAAVQAVEHAARGCIEGDAAAMVTAPIHKEALQAAGYVEDIGHLEILARLTGATRTATMLMTPGLKVVHLSTHKSLFDAVCFVRRETVFEKLCLIDETLGTWGMVRPRIGVAALNPHGGEGGLLGSEEAEEIRPAVVDAQQRGIRATGPLPADSIFNRAIAGEFDVVLALYHDQGHIAIKVHDFHQSTTATLGLPLVRTSVDHGTAFDIAGRGMADATGLGEAIKVALAISSSTLS